MSRPNRRFVPVKTVAQQDIQAVHRVRAGLMEQRKAKANQVRGLASEYGLIAPTVALAPGDPVLAGRCRERLESPVSQATRRPVA